MKSVGLVWGTEAPPDAADDEVVGGDDLLHAASTTPIMSTAPIDARGFRTNLIEPLLPGLDSSRVSAFIRISTTLRARPKPDVLPT
ncbi:MAG: hypothetical protein ACJ77A_13685 [Actinomycetota bacterium]